jgi:uncharacterized membrane protein YgcG
MLTLSHAARRRLASGLAAAIAALGLVAIGPIGPARGADTVDQITGNGDTDSKVTVRWDRGLLGADNTTVVKPRDSGSPFAFMHDDFKNLEVSVGQTQNLVHQAVRVTWKGGKETGGHGSFNSNFLQLMECYGDDNAGPRPENCQFGSLGLRAAGAGSQGSVSRGGYTCAAGAAPSATQPPLLRDGSSPDNGCDPGENPDAPGYSHKDPRANVTSYAVPFVPVGTTEAQFDPQLWPFNKFNSNEVQQAETRADGTGEVFFNTLTRRESSGLGCGNVRTDGTAQGCWLVIVPRGEYEPNGWKLSGDGRASIMQESPLGVGSWAQRIQIHLGYSPVEPNCPIGSAKERQTQGTELVSRAVYSWQLALNSAANCSKLYGFAATPEASNTAELANSMSETGLAFTTVSIGSEARRAGSAPPALPPIVYLPVAVSAVTFGFNVNLLSGYRSAPLKLTPRLAAKALTQSYKFDIVDQGSSAGDGPEWVRHNPHTITQDPEFIKLNPDVGSRGGGDPMAPMLTAEHSGVIQKVWTWVLGDSSARAWLGGTADENGMVINPAYKELNLGAAPLDSFPRSNTCYRTPGSNEPERGKCTLDWLPYVENFDEGASRVRGANTNQGANWKDDVTSPQGTPGWWFVDQPIQFPGGIFMYGVMDSASLANYGVVPAQLCRGDGTGCVSPTVASVTAAFSGLVIPPGEVPQVDPTKVQAGAYPLTSLTYAAIRLNQPMEAIVDYASFIKFAVNEGQTPGVDPGQLPHGYLPLPQPLRDVSTQIANLLTNPTTPTTTAPNNGGSGNGGGGGGSGGGGGGGGASATPNTGARPVAASSAANPFTTTSASPVPKALSTPAMSIGLIRWALVIVLTAGLVGAVGGPVLRFALSRRSPP